MRRQFGILRTTALGGLVFLLPLIVVGALVGQAVPLLIRVGKFLGEWLPIRTVTGVALSVGIGLCSLLLVCFLAGFAARLSIGQRFSTWAEKNLQLLFPRYAILRDQMAGNVGGEDLRPRLKPVLVSLHDGERLAFESDRSTDRVAVYLPGSPDTWSGHVVYVAADRVREAGIDYATAVTICEALGRESFPSIGCSGD